jgi:hypothetical protein
MRLSLLLVAVVLVMCFVSALQPKTPAASNATSPFDSYGNICWENEQARLDNFAIQLQNDPTLTGEIIVYAGRISCHEEAKYRGNRALNYVRKRGVNSGRLIFRNGGFQLDLQTVLSLRPSGAGPFELRPSLRKDEVSIKRCVDKVFARVICPNSP